MLKKLFQKNNAEEEINKMLAERPTLSKEFENWLMNEQPLDEFGIEILGFPMEPAGFAAVNIENCSIEDYEFISEISTEEMIENVKKYHYHLSFDCEVGSENKNTTQEMDLSQTRNVFTKHTIRIITEFLNGEYWALVFNYTTCLHCMQFTDDDTACFKMTDIAIMAAFDYIERFYNHTILKTPIYLEDGDFDRFFEKISKLSKVVITNNF